MRALFIVLALSFVAPSAHAQEYYAQQNYPAPTGYPPQQVTDNAGNTYAGQPVYTPQDYAPQPQLAPQPAYPQPRPSDYGQSVMTDIRQMNF